MKTLIVIILDESGSMYGKRADVIGGFNSFLNEQKAIEGDEARFYLVKFNSKIKVSHAAMDLNEVPELTNDTYAPQSTTALCDAIAKGIRLADKDKKEDERVICVIITDGEENSSQKTSYSQMKELIASHERMPDWTFLYIGENPEEWTQAMGLDVTDGVQYDHKNPENSMNYISMGVSSLRSSSSRKGKNLLNQSQII